jgi:hypothetical protein
MKLQDLLDKASQLGDDEVIFASKPWSLDAEAIAGVFDKDFRVPDSIKERNLEYFLEASVAKDVLEVFGNIKPTAEQARAVLLFYAENDAYPQWVYELQ